jgi:transposase
LARELKRPGVNLMVLWEEYRQVHPDGYGYSRYVAPGIMLRGGRRARDAALSAGPRGT